MLALEGRQTPANKAVYADPQVAGDPILKAFRQQVDVAVPMPNLPEMSGLVAGDHRHEHDRQEGRHPEGSDGRRKRSSNGSAACSRSSAGETSMADDIVTPMAG